MAVEFRLLGEVEMRVDTRAVDLGHARQRCVLVALLLEANRTVSTDQLVERVWAGQAPQRARNTLAGYVSRLRQALAAAEGPSITRPSGYRLTVDPMAVDLFRFRSLVAESRTTGTGTEALALLAEALDVWHGDAFADLDTPWLNTMRESVEAERLAAEIQRNDLALEAGRHAVLLNELPARSAEYPFDERLAGQLMLALYRSGRQADALRRFEEFRLRLADELGADPSPPLQDLHRQMLASDPALVPVTPPAGQGFGAMNGYDMGGPAQQVLEREREIAELAHTIDEAGTGAGSVVLISGEAGIGKSSLVGAMPGVLPPQGRLLTGYCDDLATPRTYGPFRDLLGSSSVELATALRHGDRERVFDALHANLSSTGRPTVLAIEDVHWSDEATIDALCFLVRRIADLPAVLVLTYRDDDLDTAHPLHRVLGQAARTRRVRRLALERLSEAAVRQLAATSRIDHRELYDVTGGNPFYVAEVLASGDTGRVPPTVVDAVLARVRGLDANTQAALEHLAVVPTLLERWLLEALLPDGIAAIAPAEKRGLLEVSPDQVAFHHELIRRAVADSLPVARRVQLNQRVLAALLARDGEDSSRIMHHAEQAGDIDAIVRYGPDAARDAAFAGAHREAAAYLRLVLRHCDRFEVAERADLLGRYAIECYTLGDMPTAVAAQQEAVDLRRTLNDKPALGVDLRWLSRVCWTAGETDRMECSADEAVEVLEAAGDDRLLAIALGNKSQLHMLADRNRESVEVGERAIALARAVGDRAILSHALNNVGSARWHLGDPEGRTMLEESLRVAEAEGATDDACRAYANIGWALLQDLQLDDASSYIADAIELAERSEYLAYLYHFYAHRAALGLATGAWDAAVVDAEAAVQALPHTRPQTKYTAQAVLGRIQIRRGQLDGERLLSEAWEFAARTRELQRKGPVAASLAEAAWLRGDRAAMAALLRPVYAEACQLGTVAILAELAYWLAKAGEPVAVGPSHHPYALQASGRWRDAAAAWRDAGCPYEHAAALAESTDAGDLRKALDGLNQLGAEPLAGQVRRRLRDLGEVCVAR